MVGTVTSNSSWEAQWSVTKFQKDFPVCAKTITIRTLTSLPHVSPSHPPPPQNALCLRDAFTRINLLRAWALRSEKNQASYLKLSQVPPKSHWVVLR